jgi:FkbM family methyltransferase
MLDRLITTFNRLPIWRRQVHLGNRVVLVPNFDRWLYVKLQALDLMGRDERSFLSRHVRPGMTVVDIGANIGVYSIFLADLVGDRGRVYAFEPDPALFEAAVTNARLNGKDELIILHNLALGSRTGKATLHRSTYNSGDNRLSPSAAHKESVPVHIVRGDDALDGAKIDLIKMDVQGWESEVLRGLEQTLRTNPALTVYFEYWPEGLRRAGETLSSPVEILRQSGFSVFVPGEHDPLSSQRVQTLANVYSGKRFVNLVAKRV